jgi:hypothetical protein
VLIVENSNYEISGLEQESAWIRSGVSRWDSYNNGRDTVSPHRIGNGCRDG